MLKTFPILLFLLAGINSAWSGQFLLPHERFQMMGKIEKEAFIVDTMELLVELESKHEKHVPHQQYTQVMKGLQSLLIPFAYAQSIKDWDYYAKAFQSSLANNTDSTACFYAGWISRTKIIDGRSLCLHPYYLESGSKERDDYIKAQTGCTNPKWPASTSDQIACNPAIFGFKNPGEKTNFCVQSGREPSYNSAYECMQLSLGIKGETGAVSKQERFDALSKNIQENPGLVTELYQFVSKACICDAKDNSTSLDEEYMKHIRPHRTCLGMMKMVGDAAISCELPSGPSLDLTIFRKLNDYNMSNDPDLLSVKNVDPAMARALNGHFKNFLNSVKNTADYDRICKGIVSPEAAKSVGPEESVEEKIANCTISVEEAEDQINFTPNVMNLNDDEQVERFDWKPAGPEEEGASVYSVKKPAKSSTPVQVSVTAIIKKGDTTRELSCGDASWQSDEEEKPKLKIAKESETVLDFVGKASVEGDLGDWKISWYTPGEGTAKTVKGGGERITVPKAKDDFKLCAELLKEEETIPAEPNCLTVPKTDTPRVAPSMNAMPPQQGLQTPMRPGTNTSATGIR